MQTALEEERLRRLKELTATADRIRWRPLCWGAGVGYDSGICVELGGRSETSKGLQVRFVDAKGQQSNTDDGKDDVGLANVTERVDEVVGSECRQVPVSAGASVDACACGGPEDGRL